MIAMLQRLCWNSSGWRLPTGSSSEGGHPRQMGFGHEEWNFQTDDAFDGNIYGHLPRPSEQIRRESEGHFQIAFWAFHPETREKLLVGYYHDATLPTTPEDYERLDTYFRDQGIYERRANELLAAVPSLGVNRARKEVTSAVVKHWLSFKCPVDKVEALSDYVALPDKVQGKSIGMRFGRSTHVSKIPSIEELKEITAEERTRTGTERRTTPLAEDGYYREFGARLKYILPRHNILSNQFSAWLRKKGYTDVRQEESGVDIEFTSGGDLCRAELKVCYSVSTTKAIREALGQLLEYNYYGNREPAKWWFIILDQQPSSNDRSYVANLQTEAGLPVVLGWREREDFQLLE